MTKPALFSGLLMFFLGAALCVGALYIFPHCHAQNIMRCVWLMRASAGIGALIMFNALILQFASRGVATGLQIANAGAGLLLIALATVLIGPCPIEMMKCHSVSQPILIVLGVALAFIALVDAWRLSRRA